jgi:hypothetical protein
VKADNKHQARLNVIRHLLHAVAAPGLTAALEQPDPDVLFPFDMAALEDGRLAR